MRLFRVPLVGTETGAELVVPEYANNLNDAIEIVRKAYSPEWEVLTDQVVEII